MTSIITLLLVLVTVIGCEKGLQEERTASPQPEPLSREDAQQKLKQLGIEYTEQAFIESARNGNAAVVTAFLDAGINPHATGGRADGYSPGTDRQRGQCKCA